MQENYINLGMDGAKFMTQFFEKEFLHFKEAINHSQYNWTQFGSDFYGIDPLTGNVSIHKNGIIDRDQYITGSEKNSNIQFDLNEDKVKDLLNSGATIVANRFDKSSLFVHGLCNEISKLTDNLTTGNAYITQGGHGTFGKHWDTHCIFASQLKGFKRWRVYRPTFELPLHFQKSIKKKNDFHGNPIFDGILNPGDILYIPRGWWHEAIPLESTPSLHIAIGVHPAKIHDYIKWLVMRKMSDNIDFRRSINRKNIDQQLIESSLKSLLSESLSAINYEEYINEINGLIISKSNINFEGIFSAEGGHHANT